MHIASRPVMTANSLVPCSHGPMIPRVPRNLVHLPDETIDLLLPVAKITTLDEMLELARPEAAVGVAQLEGPEEVGRLLEIGADGVNFVDEILDADDAQRSQGSLNY